MIDSSPTPMREADIRPAELLAEYLRLTALDIATYFPDLSRLQARSCPACGADQPYPEFTKQGFDFATCRTCGSLYATHVPDNHELGRFYGNSPSQRYWVQVFFPAVVELRRQRIFKPRVERIKQLCAQFGATPNCVTDVGAGLGVFLEESRNSGLGRTWRAVEPSTDAVSILRTNGFETFAGMAEDACDWHGSADLVTSFEVMEHVTNPLEFFRALASLARPGGLVLATGLCGSGFDIATLGVHSKAVNPPHHLNFVSIDGARRLLLRAGLEPLSILTPGELDVDIVRNTLAEIPEAGNAFARTLAQTPEHIRSEFQTLLARAGLSSHLWLLARRPEHKAQ